MQNEMNDKMLREKLNAFAPPFDEKGWEQMSAMLDNRKKRRGFFWWWLSGTSVAAVIATVGLFLLAPKAGMENKEMKNENGGYVIENGVAGNGMVDERNVVVQKRKMKNEKRGAVVVNERIENDEVRDEHFIALSNNSKQSKKHNKSSSNQKPLFAPKNKPPKKSAVKSSGVFALKSNSTSSETPVNAIVREDVLFAALHAQPTVLLSNKSVQNEIFKEEKSDDGSIKLPIKKKKFSYELGAVSGASASFTQRQFHNQANWFAGLQQAFRIGKYIAITNGLHYAKTSFALNQVSNTDSIFTPFAYTSNIQSFSIPVGINVYPVSTKRVDWFVGAGVVNNIKLKEDMLFELPFATKQVDNLQNIPTTSGNQSEQFSSASNKAAIVGDYRTGSARYFANFFATTGVEVKLLPTLLLNTGFNYQLSISKTGNQQARPMFFGGELGLRYRF